MSLSDRIETDLIGAMKSRDQNRLTTLRLVKAALKNEEIALRHPLDETEMFKVFHRLIKQREEAAQQFRAGGRIEAADQEEAEAQILAAYLPTQLAETELINLIDAACNELGAATPNDLGKVIGLVKQQVGAQADGARIAQLVKQRLVTGSPSA